MSSVKIWIDKNFIQSTKGSGEVLTNLEKANIIKEKTIKIMPAKPSNV